MAFVCKQCGACCRHAKLLRDFNEQVAQITGVEDIDCEIEFDDTGSCRYYSVMNCLIFKDRPECCRGEVVYEKLLKDKMTKEEYDAQRELVCEFLRRL
jgi:hypothetical protein